jgi:hypothetical protein
MRLFIRRYCVACDESYRVWFWEPPTERLNICCEKCRRVLDKGFELGRRSSGLYKDRKR